MIKPARIAAAEPGILKPANRPGCREPPRSRQNSPAAARAEIQKTF